MMTKKEFIGMYTSRDDKVLIGIKTPQHLNFLLYVLAKLKIDLPSSFIIDNLRIGLSMNRGVGLLLKSTYTDTLHWSYTSNADEIRGGYVVKWFNEVKTNVLEGDKL